MERWDSMGVLGLICRLYREREAEDEAETKVESPDASAGDEEEEGMSEKKCSCIKTFTKTSDSDDPEAIEQILIKDENEDNETCSACDKRSEAINWASAELSAMINTSEGPAGRSMAVF